MKFKLALSLTGTRLVLEVLQPADAPGVRGLLRQLLPSSSAPSGTAPHEVMARVELTVPSIQDSLRSMIAQALSDLAAAYSGSLHGLDIEVRLGLEHAQIGVMVLDVSATSLASSTCEAYTHAWVKQMLHLDPETQVIRWQILADTRKLLISCIDRRVFEALDDACQQHGFRFASCRPAVLSALSGPAAPDGLTIVWTEAAAGAARSSVVQLMRLERTQVSSTWRGWLPPPCESNDLDRELEGAIRRFQAHHAAEGGEPVHRRHWG